MIIRYAGRSVSVDAISPENVRKVFNIVDLEAQLLAAQKQVLVESANGPSLALRRMREKVKRLERRIGSTTG